MTRLTLILAAEVVAAFVLLKAQIHPVTLGWQELKLASGLASLLGPRLVIVTALGCALLMSLRRDASSVERPAHLGPTARATLLGFNALSFATLLACTFGFERETPLSHAALFLLGLTGVTLTAARLVADTLGTAARRAMGVLTIAAAVSFATVLAVRWAAWAVEPLSDAAWSWTAAIFRFFGSEVRATLATRELIVGTFRVIISAGCSGVEGVALMTVCLSVYVVAFRRSLRFPAALILFPVGLALIWMANLARLVLLMLIGAHLSPTIAIGGFHTQAGWILFNACTLGLVLASQRSRFVMRASTELMAPPVSTLYLAPLLASAAIALAIGIFVAEFDWYYPIRVAFLLAVLALVLPRLKERLWKVDLAGLAAGVVTYAIWIALESFRLAPELDAKAATHLASVPQAFVVAWIIARALGAVVVAPLAEELAFRGFLARRLQAEDFTALPYAALRWPAIAVSSVAFGLAHGQVAGAVIAGVLYSLAAKRTGSLGTAVFAHAVTNAMLAVHIVLTGRWSLWG